MQTRPARPILAKLILACICVLLTGCGGGGRSSGGGGNNGNSSGGTPSPTSIVPLPTPVFERSSTIHVGTNASPTGLAQVGSVQDGITRYRGQRTDGTSEATILAMFKEITPPEDVIFPITFRTRPTVRVVRGAGADFRKAVQDAVAIINSVLPWERQIQFDFDAARVTAPALLSAIPDEHIYIEHSTPDRWTRIHLEAAGHGTSVRRDRFLDVGKSNNYSLAGWVGVNRLSGIDCTGGQCPLRNANYLRHTLVHELLHQLGFWGHSERFPDSVLTAGGNYSGAIAGTGFVLAPSDKDLIHAAYTRLAPGITPRRAITDLGEWSTTSVHQVGTFSTGGGRVRFGVWERNGLVQPWAQGPTPTGTLDATANWDGLFLGVTSSGNAVDGDVRLAVDMANMSSGRLTFSDLKQVDDDAQWDNGNLDYTVAIDEDESRFDNHRSSDAGIVTGVFLGTDHTAMAGTLRRRDLTGAFGGKQR